MRKRVIEVLGLAALLFGVTVAVGQPGPEPLPEDKKKADPKKAEPKKSALEEMLEQALRNNPDIHVAEAKVREAEAELFRTRLLVTQKLVAMNASVDVARKTAEEATTRYRMLQELQTKVGGVSAEEVRQAALIMQTAKAEVAKLEAELPYLIGKAPVDSTTERGLRWLRQSARAEEQAELARLYYFRALGDAHAAWVEKEKGPEADKLRTELNKRINFVCEGKSYPEGLNELAKAAPGVTIQIRGGVENAFPQGGRMFANLRDVPLGAALEYFEDALPDHAFYVRDYGLLLVPAGQRSPTGAVPVREFWKSDKSETKDKSEKKN
jgi:hypothetical protein